jgi:hypothetical protein
MLPMSNPHAGPRGVPFLPAVSPGRAFLERSLPEAEGPVFPAYTGQT